MTLSLKSILLSVVMTAGTAVMACAWEVPDETLHYSVRFKWGLIDANVGIATVSTRNIPGTDSFEATLSGKSIDLLGHYYVASDDITGTILAHPDIQCNKAALTSQHGEFSIETITGNAEGPSKNGPVTGHLPDGKVIRSRESNYASGLSTDLLSVFYYMRQIDYAIQQPGSTFNISLSNGNQIDRLQIIYIGTDDITVNGSVNSCRHISLNFTAGSKSDSLEVWIGNDEARTPLFIKGSLSVGHMVCSIVYHQTIDSMTLAD